MLPVKYWNIWTWLFLACTLLNLYFFFTTGGVFSLVCGGIAAYCFYLGVK